MSKLYHDSRYGVEKILTFPGHCDNISAAGNVSQMSFADNIILTEFGVVVTEIFSAAGALASVELREGSVVLGSITIPSSTAIGTLITTTTLTTTSIAAGDTLIFYRNATCLTTGETDGYVKYRERYVVD